ncbi:RICIN domain-containing protein [Dactylosporangium sp. CA-092794]|uniref:RICIN domain-containing protein n=1 Tax=Dactylosporangium sp. CA-092794 TaxID=3239929 RepID=UPI003D8E69D1
MTATLQRWRRPTLPGLLLGILTMAAGLLAAPSAAQAGAGDPVYIYQNQGTNRCLEDSFNNGLRTYPCDSNKGNPQRWRVHSWADGTVRLQNVYTAHCLDDTFDFGLRTWDCNDGENQSWWVVYWGDETRRFQNQATGRCIEDSYVNGFRMASNCDDSVWQSWYKSV